MTLPTLENTWVFNTGRKEHMNEGSDEATARRMQHVVKNMWCGQLRVCYQGAFADQGGSVFRYTPSEIGVDGFSGLFESADVGRDIEFRNSTSAGNDGQFTITAVDPSGLWVEYTNASGVAEAYPSSARVIDPKWATLVNGRSPWRCKGSGCGTLGKGNAIDGVDRWITTADNNQSSTSGNRTWFVFENEITGAEIMWWNDTNTTSLQWVNMEWQVSPELGFTGGTATTRPTATDEQQVNSRNDSWNGTDTGWDNLIWWFNMMISDDGVHTNFWFSPNRETYAWLQVRQPSDTISDAAIPWSGSRNFMDWSRSTAGIFKITSFVDSAQYKVTFDSLAAAGGPYKVSMYMTTEFAVSSSNLEINSIWPNQVSEDMEIYPVGLACPTAPVRGRHCRLSDVWISLPVDDRYPFVTGALLGGGSFIKLGHFILPWDGSKYENY